MIQAQLVEDGLGTASTVAWIGSFCAACISIFAIATANITRRIGYKATFTIGVVSLGLGEILSGWAARSVGGLFVTAGLVMGIGFSCIYYVNPTSESPAPLLTSTAMLDPSLSVLCPPPRPRHRHRLLRLWYRRGHSVHHHGSAA